MKRSLLSTTAFLFQSSVLTAGASDEPHRERTTGLRGVTSTSTSWGDDDDDDTSSATIGVSAALSPHNGQCESGTSFFQLDLHTDESGCETSWILERITATSDDDEKAAYEYIDGFESNYDDIRHAASEELCLPPGQYRFTILDAFGDGIAEPGYYLLALDQNVFAGSSNFGYDEVTLFVVTDTEEGAEAAASGVEVETGEVGFIADADHTPASATSSDDEEEEQKDSITPDRISGIIDVALASSTQSPTPSPVVTIDPPAEKSKRPLDSPQEHSDLDEPYISSWVELYNQDFVDNDMGIFHSSGVVTYYPFVKDRHGVLRIQNEDSQDSTGEQQQQDHHESTVFSDNIAIDPTATQLQIQFSFYTNSMEIHDGFCIDTSANDGMSWYTRKCWHSQTDFENGQWYDDASMTFNVAASEEESMMGNHSLRIRFRSKTNSLHDDVLIDRVRLLEMVETEMKDSI